MSEAAPSEKSEPHPFEKFRDFAAKIIAVPKAEADKQDRKWREERSEKKKSKRP